VAIYNESGLTLELPDGLHFRFAELPAYKGLSGQNLKEMDFAWVDTGKLFLLEVRSYAKVTATLTGAEFVPAKGQAAPHRFEALVDKLTDSLLMLLAAWADTDTGKSVKTDLPAVARTRLPLKLVIAVELPPNLVVHLIGLRDSLNARMRGRVALADVRTVVLMDYARLVANPRFSPFVRLQV
jgi:hypothetical protein